MASDTCLALLVPTAWRALLRAWAKTGNRMAARIAMMAITTSSSISVKPRFVVGLLEQCMSGPPLGWLDGVCGTGPITRAAVRKALSKGDQCPMVGFLYR